MLSSSEPRPVEVDGEQWEVTAHDGQYDFTWISGPDPGYGFSSKFSDPRMTLSEESQVQMIREFMGNVNPETGHLD